MLEHGQEGEARVEEHDWVRHEIALVLHLQDAHKDAARAVCAPDDARYAEEVAYQRVEVERDAGERGEHEREKAVAQHGRDAVRVDPGRRHEVEEEVDGEVAEEGDAVDVAELRLAGLDRRRP